MMRGLLYYSGVIFLIGGISIFSFCFARDEALLSNAAQITSQARESLMTQDSSLQKWLEVSAKKGEESQGTQSLVKKSHQSLGQEKKQAYSAFLQKVEDPLAIPSVFEDGVPLEQAVDNRAATPHNFSRAMGHLAALSAIQDSFSLADSERESLPDLFTGIAYACHRLKHLPLTETCCASSLDKNKQGVNHCSEADVRLAKARAASRTHYVGKYCRRRLRYTVGNSCIEETQVYCVFPSKMVRQIQEQGRQQINQLAIVASSAEHNAVIHDLSWPYKSVVASWHRCLVGSVGIGLWSGSSANKTVVFAICQQAEQCGALPLPPFTDGLIHEGWLLVKQPIHQANWQLLNDFLSVRGECKDVKCLWQIKVLGVAGLPNTMTTDLAWNSTKSEQENEILQTSTGIEVRPLKEGIQFKMPGEKVWQFVSLPPLILRSSALIINAKPRVLVWGGCELRTGYCHYYFSHQVNVHAIPWGFPQAPNCRGLNQEELVWINWDRVNLQESL